MIIFKGGSMKMSSLPLPRKRTDLWALWHVESPTTNPVLNYNVSTIKMHVLLWFLLISYFM